MVDKKFSDLDPKTGMLADDIFALARSDGQSYSMTGQGMGMSIYPSSDTSGATDGAAITAAIASIPQASDGNYYATIYLRGGMFYTNVPIVTPVGCNIVGDGRTNLLPAGTFTATDWLLTAGGLVKGLYLQPQDLAKGLQVLNVRYKLAVQDVQIFDGGEDAFWANTCFGSIFDSLTLTTDQVTGFARRTLKMSVCHRSYWRALSFNSGTQTAGTHVLEIDDSDDILIDGLNMEVINSNDPLVLLNNSHRVTIRNTVFEPGAASINGNPIFSVEGTPQNDTPTLILQGVVDGTSSGASSIIRTSSTSRDAFRLEDVDQSSSVATSMVEIDGTNRVSHNNPTFINCFSDTVAPANWVNLTNGAQLVSNTTSIMPDLEALGNVVYPSGDGTGQQDWDNINAAKANGPVGLIPDEIYRTNAKLENVGLYAAGRGFGRPIINYVGPSAPTDFMVENTLGTYRDVENIQLQCFDNIGGVYISGYTAHSILNGTKVFEPLTKGIFLENCWSDITAQMFVSEGTGIGIHLLSCNSTNYVNANIFGMTSTGAGEYPLWIQGPMDTVKLDNLIIQSCTCNANPAIFMDRVENAVLESVRLESNVWTAGAAAILYNPQGSNPSAMAQRLNGGILASGTFPTTLVRCTQRSGLKIDGWNCGAGLQNVVQLGAGNHAYPIITNSYFNGMAPEDRVFLELSAIINPSGIDQHPDVANTPIFTDVSFSSPPTAAQLTTYFGDPTTLIGVEFCVSSGGLLHKCKSDGTNWIVFTGVVAT